VTPEQKAIIEGAARIVVVRARQSIGSNPTVRRLLSYAERRGGWLKVTLLEVLERWNARGERR